MGTNRFQTTPDMVENAPERLALVSIGLAGVDEGWDMPVAQWHAPTGFDSTEHPDNFTHHILTLALSGARVRRVKGSGSVIERDPCSPSFVCLQPAGRDNRFVCEGPIRFAHLYFQPSFLRWIAADLYPRFHGEVPFFDSYFAVNAETRRMAEVYVERALDAADVPSALEMDARAALVGIQIAKRHTLLGERYAPPRLARGGLAPFQVRRATEYLEANLAGNVGLEDLSRFLGLSPFHLCRAFKQSTGLAPHQWLTARRIGRAKELLVTSSLSLTEVALACGFGSSQHFAAAFRKATGTTPSHYRRQNWS